jgi:hypothetical protein
LRRSSCCLWTEGVGHERPGDNAPVEVEQILLAAWYRRRQEIDRDREVVVRRQLDMYVFETL